MTPELMAYPGLEPLCLDGALASHSLTDLMPSCHATNLGPHYQINCHDVLCGRGKRSFLHSGNQRFRKLVGLHLDIFLSSKRHVDKRACIKAVIETVRSSGGHFLNQNKLTKEWYDIGDLAAFDKVGHALRDAGAERRRGEQFQSSMNDSSAVRRRHCENDQEDFEEMNFHPIDDHMLENISLIDVLDFNLAMKSKSAIISSGNKL
jgi:hypothetical protein